MADIRKFNARFCGSGQSHSLKIKISSVNRAKKYGDYGVTETKTGINQSDQNGTWKVFYSSGVL